MIDAVLYTPRMRSAVPVWLVLLASVACSGTAPTEDESTARPPAPAAPAPSPAGPVGGRLELGKDTEVTQGRTYRVGDVTVAVLSIGMASGQDAQGRDNHWIQMKLRVEQAGQVTDVDLSGDAPGEAARLTFHADALGYQWGATPATATLRVERK